ncbi:MAG: nucleoside-diphosphate kinase [Nitrospira sp.]|nr:nucleoside-diphosphate kinase [Candidatus Manganitrophaceae bacterium]HIL34895.1 nucleoside-diphosphate kinase [Candidatus Manganitrophaceae bacterium]
MTERTLSMIKPDGVSKNVIGEVLRRFEAAHLKVIAIQMRTLTKKEAEGFYAVHRERGFFDSLVTFMSSGPLVALVLEGEGAILKNRSLMGATDPKQAEAGSIRADLAGSIEENIVHGSDSKETADFEISYFFSQLALNKGTSE